MNKEEVIKNWIESSDRNYKSMNYNFKGKHYDWSLFIGHLVIEKLLKALYVKVNSKNPPPIHNLQRLAELIPLNISEDQNNFLDDITAFNIQAR